MAAIQELTLNLIEWRNGNDAAIEEVLPAAYNELRLSTPLLARRSF